MTLTYYRPETYSKLSYMFENPTIGSNIIEVDLIVPEICHFLCFPRVTAAILEFGPYRGLKNCKLRFLFSSHPNKVKSITISLWASDSYGKYIPVYNTKGVLSEDVVGCIATWQRRCNITSNLHQGHSRQPKGLTRRLLLYLA